MARKRYGRVKFGNFFGKGGIPIYLPTPSNFHRPPFFNEKRYLSSVKSSGKKKDRTLRNNKNLIFDQDPLPIPLIGKLKNVIEVMVGMFCKNDKIK